MAAETETEKETAWGGVSLRATLSRRKLSASRVGLRRGLLIMSRHPLTSQRRLTQQLTKQWTQFKALRQHYAGTRFEEQRQLHLPQKHKATVPESTLRVEMNGLEEQADNAKARDLYWKPLSWLRTIQPSSANDAFRLRPSDLDDVCLHDARFGGSHALLRLQRSKAREEHEKAALCRRTRMYWCSVYYPLHFSGVCHSGLKSDFFFLEI
jgi:hypothetical protein